VGIRKYGDRIGWGPFVQGDQIFVDHFSMGILCPGDQFYGDCLSRGTGSGDRKSGDQIGSGPNASQPIDDVKIDHALTFGMSKKVFLKGLQRLSEFV
jgi:hypothetical protein